jgi:outer membrane murein-binding lipoprotein Lpp
MIIAAAIISIIAVAACIGLMVQRRSKVSELRDLLEFSQNQIDELQDVIRKTAEMNDAARDRSADQARRIAWLESRMRKPKPLSADVLDDSVITEQPRLSMTERRHRVIKLANSGKNVEAIATSLGLFRGEVELILSLNQVTAGGR